jgi:hypothetical protein
MPSDWERYLASHKGLALVLQGDRTYPKRLNHDRSRPCFEAIDLVATVPES